MKAVSSFQITHCHTSFNKPHWTSRSGSDAWQLWFTEELSINTVPSRLWRVAGRLMSGPYWSLCLQRRTWIRSSACNTCELRGLLLAPGERREAHEAGEANLEGPLSPGVTLSSGLAGWAAAAGWKNSAGRWNKGGDPPPPLLQLPPSLSEKTRSNFNTDSW